MKSRHKYPLLVHFFSGTSMSRDGLQHHHHQPNHSK